MIHEDISFLPFFIHEPIYKIPEDNKKGSDDGLNCFWSGSFDNDVFVFLDYKDRSIFEHKDRSFLFKVLASVNLEENQVAIVDIQSLESQTMDLIKKKEAKMIFFDVDVSQWGVEKLPLYQLKQQGSLSMFSSKALYVVQQHKEEKIQLWRCLKAMFALT